MRASALAVLCWTSPAIAAAAEPCVGLSVEADTGLAPDLATTFGRLVSCDLWTQRSTASRFTTTLGDGTTIRGRLQVQGAPSFEDVVVTYRVTIREPGASPLRLAGSFRLGDQFATLSAEGWNVRLVGAPGRFMDSPFWDVHVFTGPQGDSAGPLEEESEDTL